MLKFSAVCRLQSAVLIVWLAFLGMHGYYFLLDYRDMPHPSYLPLFTLIAVQGIALLFAVFFGVWRLIRGPRRLCATAWLSLGFLPVFLWYSQVSLSFHIIEERRVEQVDENWYLVTASPIAAALFDGVARWTLPHQLEGERAVMFYDASIADPKSDLEKMDEFIKKEEEYLGVSMPTKIHWFRTPLFGLPGLALMYVAVAAPAEKGVGYIDYHEAAHNIISVPSTYSAYTGRYPPMFLIEGWAQSRSTDWDSLVSQCWKLKQSHEVLTLREAVSDVYYNSSNERIYDQGGAFVKVLCDKFGPEKFLKLYTTCARKTFEQDVERIYGMTCDELDALYWYEMETYRASFYEKATEKCSPEEKALLEEFRDASLRQMEDFYRRTENGTLAAVVRSSYHGPDRDDAGRSELLFQAKDGRLARFHRKHEGTQTDTSKETGEKTECRWERIDSDLMTPNEWLTTFQYSSSEKNSSQQNTWRNAISPQEREYTQQRFKRHHLRMLQPFSLFETGFGHSFSDLEYYLWTPPDGTVVQSVVVDGDTVVLTLTTAMSELVEQTLTLRMDRSRDRLLLDAKCQETVKGKPLEYLDIREYGDDVLFPKKRSVSRIGPEYQTTEDTELVRLDPTPVDEAVFREENLPLSVPPTGPARQLSAAQRTWHHLAIAAVWLVVPMVIILLCRQSEPHTK